MLAWLGDGSTFGAREMGRRADLALLYTCLHGTRPYSEGLIIRTLPGRAIPAKSM